MTTVVFPDLEPIVVSALQAFIDDSFEAFATDVRVGTKKLPSGSIPQSEVVVMAAYQDTVNKVMRNAQLMIEVYADDYATASQLAHFVAARCPHLVGDPIKFAEVSVGPARLAEEGPQEKRSMTVDLVVKGADYVAPVPSGS